MIKNRKRVKQMQQQHYQQDCKEIYEGYLLQGNSFFDRANDFGLRITKVATPVGPIIKTTFPEKDVFGEKCLTDIYKGTLVRDDKKVFIKAVLEEFFESNDVWIEGFVLRDGIAEKINPANVSNDHYDLICELRRTFREKYEEQANIVENNK